MNTESRLDAANSHNQHLQESYQEVCLSEFTMPLKVSVQYLLGYSTFMWVSLLK